jgi:hypothetical protein
VEIVENVWHVISSGIIFLFGGYASVKLSKKFKIKNNFALILYLWHTCFCFVYMAYAMKYTSDVSRYFRSTNLNISDFKLGTKAVEFITNILRTLDLSYLGCFLVFNIIGMIGLLAFAGSLISVTKNSTKHIKTLALILIFLPSISFWSSAIGKDPISFMATGLALWAALDFKNRKLLIIFSILAMLIVRPHIAGIMVIAISLSIIFDKNVNIKFKAFILMCSLAVSAVLIPFALQYAGVGENISSESLQTFVETREGTNLDGGSSLDISTMTLPMKMFTYMFRPLPFEAHNITALLASIDNVVLLFIFILSAKHLTNKNLQKDLANRKFMWAYALVTLVILSLTTANLGIAMRQKWMFIPMFAYLFISAISAKRSSPFK